MALGLSFLWLFCCNAWQQDIVNDVHQALASLDVGAGDIGARAPSKEGYVAATGRHADGQLVSTKQGLKGLELRVVFEGACIHEVGTVSNDVLAHHGDEQGCLAAAQINHFVEVLVDQGLIVCRVVGDQDGPLGVVIVTARKACTYARQI